MVLTLEVSERMDALGAVLHEISTVLDGLLSSGALTTNFMEADRSGGTVKYVPAYLFEFIRHAGTCASFEDSSRDHRAFLDLMISYVSRNVPGASTSPLSDLRSRLRRFPTSSVEHRDEARVLHMSRMLDIGWALLDEAASAGLWERDLGLAATVTSAAAAASPPLPYGTRKGVVQRAVELLRSKSLDREASAAEAFLHFNPAIHG